MGKVVQDGKVVVIHYTLERADGSVIESTRGKAPMAYLHGKKNVVPGLEAAMGGRAVGERFRVVVPASEGYGERQSTGAQAVPRREFPKHIQLTVGLPLEIRAGDGTPVRVFVTRVQGSRVWIDVDHPLAGVELHFDVEILGVRDPLPDELEHGHAHGHDGAHATHG